MWRLRVFLEHSHKNAERIEKSHLHFINNRYFFCTLISKCINTFLFYDTFHPRTKCSQFFWHIF